MSTFGLCHDRQPFVVRPRALSFEESEALLLQQCGTISVHEVEEIVTMCGGHPRSLTVAACKFKAKTPNSVPTPNEVALECNWKTSEGRPAGTIAGAIGEAFTQGDDELNKRSVHGAVGRIRHVNDSKRALRDPADSVVLRRPELHRYWQIFTKCLRIERPILRQRTSRT